MSENKASKLLCKVDINLKDLEQFKHIVEVIGELVIDERIPEAVRKEYTDKMIRWCEPETTVIINAVKSDGVNLGEIKRRMRPQRYV